jgi:hypothetical protein
MRSASICAACITVGFLWVARNLTPGVTAQPKELTAPAAGLDLAPFLDLGDYYVKPVPEHKDAKTGFIVGGKNETNLIRTLKSLNDRTIAELEKDMRPAAQSEVGSESGFLGPDERLLDVLTTDNKYVTDDLGLTHQELAKHLHALGTIGLWQRKHQKLGAEFVYHGRRFKVKVEVTRGTQPSPFQDGTTSGSNATVWNLDNGKKFEYALLVPYMVERYGFYEGKGTPYRTDPRQIIEVFDFLQPKTK